MTCIGKLFQKVLSNFGCNLAIRHFVDRFNIHNTSTERFILKTFYELDLCLARTKYQNRFRITDT